MRLPICASSAVKSPKMPNKMLIDATHPEETRVVVVRGNRVEEFDFETAQRKQLRGNIYLAKVTRVEPSLQAAFIEYGGNRHGFLAFSEIHPDYYQIPVADRQALIEADERAHREAEEESENRSSRHRRPRQRNSRRRGNGERVQSEIVDVESSDPAQAAQPRDHEHHDHAHGENGHSHAHDAGHHPADAGHHDHEGHEHSHEHVHDHADQAHEHAQAQHDHGHAASQTSAPESQTEMPVSESIETSAALTPDAPVEPEIREHRAHEEHAFENQAYADDAPPAEQTDGEYAASHQDEHAATPQSDEQHDDEEDDGDEVEEEIVESVGGDDVLEEVPERAFRPRRQYKIQEVIKRRQVMLVQVVKEERGNKGAALTTYLSLAGRYAVLMPNTARGGGISRKITSAQDRSRLKEVVQDLDVPEGMGIILRTAGASRTKPEIKRDFEYLIRMWETVRDMTLKSQAPTLVYEEGSLIKRSLRDLYNKEID
ncbi:MAG: ribonuclease, partial [Bradyrhizobium sp.]|nr:ribonuclease [Bradyrhizobium sp.]